MDAAVGAYFRRRTEIPGWFALEDFLLFDRILGGHASGDLLEIGAFQGASAILIGLHRRGEEVFTVCDLFGTPDEPANAAESEIYEGLTRESFERNYLEFVPELPVIVQESSLSIL